MVYLNANKGQMQLDFLGRFESLNEDYKYIMEKLQLKFELTETNKSKRKDYKEYYNETVRQKISDLYSKDIQIFDYNFDWLVKKII